MYDDAADVLTELVAEGRLTIVGWDCMALDEGGLGVRYHYALAGWTPKENA